ncbi:I78 family peptidase inhibitor [Phyllobacterium bourgognense]|uniref:I78 family peptidase inhibitor n=1 Tax=Phyllobacterium bourgognense TaxID=314236 RepID=UPI000DF11E79
MSKQHPPIATTAVFFSLGLVACAADDSTNSGRSLDQCNPIAAQTLVGRSGVMDSEAKSITGAVTIRRISPGDMVTQDFRKDRLTMEVDSHGIVIRAVCG